MKAIQFKNNSNLVQSSATLDKIKTKDGLDINQVISTNISSLVSSQALDDQEISGLELSVAGLSSNISNIQSQVSTATVNISQLQTQLTTANSNISTLQTTSGVHTSDIFNLTTAMTTANTNISATRNDLISVSQRTATCEGNINSLTTNKANLTGGNSFSGLQVFGNGNDTSLQVTNMASSGHVAFSGGDKTFQVNTGSIALGAASGSNLELWNPKSRGFSIFYDNPPILYSDMTSQITNNLHLTNKKYVDDAIAAIPLGITLSNVTSTANTFTAAQSYDNSVMATGDNNLISRSQAAALDTTASNQIYKFSTGNCVIGGETTTITADTSFNPARYKLTFPNTGTNIILNSQNINNYSVASVRLVLPNKYKNNTLIATRTCSLRLRLEMELAQPLSGILSNDWSKNPDAHTAVLDNMPVPTMQPGSSGHCYIDTYINLSVSGVSNYVHLTSNLGTKIITNDSNATTNDWAYNKQSQKFTSNGLVYWNPFTFSAVDGNNVDISVNLPNKTNRLSYNYWVLGYSYRLDIINSLPSPPTTSDNSVLLTKATNFTASDTPYSTGGAYFTINT